MTYTYLLETMTAADKQRKQALVRELLGRVGDKWTLLVIETLAEAGQMRFLRLQQAIGGISQKMLTKTLRQLERDGLVARRVHAVVPPRVEYRLTALGESLGESLCGVWQWVGRHLAAVERSRKSYDARRPDDDDRS